MDGNLSRNATSLMRQERLPIAGSTVQLLLFTIVYQAKVGMIDQVSLLIKLRTKLSPFANPLHDDFRVMRSSEDHADKNLKRNPILTVNFLTF